VKRRLGLALLSVLLVSARARASGFATTHFGGEHGNVTETNPTAVYFNPGAIGASRGIHLYVDGVLAVRSVGWTHPASPNDTPEPMDGMGTNSGKTRTINVFGAPMLGATLRLSDAFVLGAAISVPFGGRVWWPKKDEFTSTYPLATDGVQRWHSIEGSLTYIYNSLALAYRLGPLSLGASVNLIKSSLLSKKARTFKGDTNLSGNAEGRSELDVSGTEGSFGLGVLFEAMEQKLWLAASYQAQPGLGAMRLKGKASIYIQGSAVYDATFDQALPDIVRLGARFRPEPKIELRLFGDMTRWSVMKTQCVANAGYPCQVYGSGPMAGADATGKGGVLLNLRRQWRDTYGVNFGGSYWIAPSLELFAGLGFETAAVPDATLDPEIPDANNWRASVGARVELGSKWFLGGTFRYLYFFERNNIGKSELAQTMVPTRQPDGGGIYTQWIGILNANVEKEF